MGGVLVSRLSARCAMGDQERNAKTSGVVPVHESFTS
jgi:hypothetical protein